MASDKAKEVSAPEVARYYLKCELGYVLPELSQETDFEEIDKKSEDEVMMLGEALATHYRCNAVWWVVADPLYHWTEEEVPVSQVRMSGMGDDTAITDLIYSEEIQNDPLKLKRRLADYYQKHPDDPEKYDVKPGRRIKLPKVLLVEYKGELRLLDGSHRFIEQLLNGAETVTAYVARSSRKPAVIRPMVGDGEFRILFRAYRNTDSPDEKAKIREFAQMLAANSYLKNPNSRFDELLRGKAGASG